MNDIGRKCQPAIPGSQPILTFRRLGEMQSSAFHASVKADRIILAGQRMGRCDNEVGASQIPGNSEQWFSIVSVNKRETHEYECECANHGLIRSPDSVCLYRQTSIAYRCVCTMEPGRYTHLSKVLSSPLALGSKETGSLVINSIFLSPFPPLFSLSVSFFPFISSLFFLFCLFVFVYERERE